MKRPQHITITSIKYLISYPIKMKVSNPTCWYVLQVSVNARADTKHTNSYHMI